MGPISVKDAAKMMNLDSSSDLFITSFSVDSRTVRSGSLFFALPGEATDGHAFLEAAATSGAVAAVVLKGYSGLDFGLQLIYSEDVLSSLQLLAKVYLLSTRARVVAVTGSVGKTTTKEFLAQILRRKYRVAASPGNANSQIGMPLSILNGLNSDDEILVQEMGMDHPGNIARLIEIAPPTISVVTSVALVHACYFDSIEGIANAKAEIFGNPTTQVGIYNLESNYGDILKMSGRCPKYSFSTGSSKADFSLDGNKLTSPFESGDLFPLSLPGAHNRHNLLAAVSVAQYLGMSLAEINVAVQTLSLPDKRFQVVERDEVLFINDAYNACEVSIKAAIDSLPAPKQSGRRIAVLSDMRELGKFAEQCHRSVAEYALGRIDLLLCYGDESRHMYSVWQEAKRPVIWAPTRAEISAALSGELKPGDVVLLKGSNSMQVWKVLEDLEQIVLRGR